MYTASGLLLAPTTRLPDRGRIDEEMTGMHQQKLNLGTAGYEFAGFSPERWETLRRIAGERCEAARWREEQKARGICPAIKIMEDLIG